MLAHRFFGGARVLTLNCCNQFYMREHRLSTHWAVTLVEPPEPQVV